MWTGVCLTACVWVIFPKIFEKMSIDSAVLEEKKVEETNGTKKREESGDELERKEQDAPLEIGEHYLVKRGEDSWRKY